MVGQIITAKILVKILNENFPQGKSDKKTKFTINDIIHYIRRGNIPHKYGGNILTKIRENNSVKITIGDRKS